MKDHLNEVIRFSPTCNILKTNGLEKQEICMFPMMMVEFSNLNHLAKRVFNYSKF